ncbi:MAG: enoyl-CoA hydratase/isomerase family protein [Anaerovoracaceae bacterium]
MSDKVLVSIENGIAVVTINRPEVRNAVDKETWGLLRETFENLDSNRDVRVIIVTGAGEKAFVAGADLNSLKVRSVLETLDSENNAVVRAIEKVSKPTIAAINGYCLGGGCEIALACDIRIAAEKAKIGQTELNVGILPGAGGTQRLRNLVGQGKAMEMILTGEPVSAHEAYEIGLVNKVVPLDKLMEEAMSMAKKIAEKSPVVTKLAKRAIQNGADLPIDTGLLIEILSQSVVFSTKDHLEGINAFLEKRKPEYTGE